MILLLFCRGDWSLIDIKISAKCWEPWQGWPGVFLWNIDVLRGLRRPRHWVLTLSWPRTNHSLTPRPLDQSDHGSGGPLGLGSQASLEVSQPQLRITTSTGQLVVEAVWNYWGWDPRKRVASTFSCWTVPWSTGHLEGVQSLWLLFNITQP